MCTYFKTETEDYSLRKKIWGYEVSFWKSRTFVFAELNETVEATTSSYYAAGGFLWYIYSVLVFKNHENIMRTAIISYLLKYFYSFSAAELNNIESENDVFAKEFSCEDSDFGDSNDEDIDQLYIWQVK